jgi:hypothetical protein
MSGLNTTQLTWAKINSHVKRRHRALLQKLIEMTSDAKQEANRKLELVV